MPRAASSSRRRRRPKPAPITLAVVLAFVRGNWPILCAVAALVSWAIRLDAQVTRLQEDMTKVLAHERWGQAGESGPAPPVRSE